MQLSVLILAAGQGKRMRSALPKVLHRLGGACLLEHVYRTAQALQPARITAVYGHGGEQVPETLAGLDLQWVYQPEQLGTGHAVRLALQARAAAADDVVLVLYGDVPLTRAATLRPLVEAARGGALGLLTVTLADPRGYGRIIRDPAGAVARIVEDRDAEPAERAVCEVNTGILAAPAGELAGLLEHVGCDNAQGEYYLTDVFALAAARGLAVHAVDAGDPREVLGVNSRAQLAELERELQRRVAERLMDEGATLADPARIDVRGALHAGEDVFIDVGCVFEGEVTLGAGASVGPYCVIRDTRIGAGAQILPHSVIEESDIGARCAIGPFARLRPGAQFETGAKAGNFVEVKKSVIGEGSKVNHLSYVGDSTLGRNVNVGAGTITCNYDGAFKHHTRIGDDVFIGSDCQLIAPVEVGAGATIGAGSTITRDVGEGELALTRSKQRTIKGWQRPRKT